MQFFYFQLRKKFCNERHFPLAQFSVTRQNNTYSYCLDFNTNSIVLLTSRTKDFNVNFVSFYQMPFYINMNKTLSTQKYRLLHTLQRTYIYQTKTLILHNFVLISHSNKCRDANSNNI